MDIFSFGLNSLLWLDTLDSQNRSRDWQFWNTSLKISILLVTIPLSVPLLQSEESWHMMKNTQKNGLDIFLRMDYRPNMRRREGKKMPNVACNISSFCKESNLQGWNDEASEDRTWMLWKEVFWTIKRFKKRIYMYSNKHSQTSWTNLDAGELEKKKKKSSLHHLTNQDNAKPQPITRGKKDFCHFSTHFSPSPSTPMMPCRERKLFAACWCDDNRTMNRTHRTGLTMERGQ